MRRPRLVVLLVLLAMPGPALAQEPVRADDLPVSLARIKRGLRDTSTRESPLGLKLAYYVNVVGESPQVNLFKDFDSRTGRVPFAAPTHQELFDQVTPQEFKSPPADLLGAAAWLGGKLVKKAVDRHRQ
jgi:hypothetical protein